MSTVQPPITSKSAKWRFKAGIAILCLMLALWLLVPLAAAADVPRSTIAAITGALFIINKVLLLLVIAVMGKAGFQELKQKVFGYVSGLVPSAEQEVSVTRHRIGLVMFCLPLLCSFLEPYIDAFAPGFRPNSWALQLLGDVLLIGSFFVLGGNFWEKLRALFIRTARVNTAADAV
ncbi:transporter suffix domain-containing protein [Pseudomonas sp. R1-15]|uniref:transporter suffix domain-containing protein n=1 Tax=Pseudomonas sp. R1-15 TaxID=2817399 RepID=UPI003DAA06EA